MRVHHVTFILSSWQIRCRGLHPSSLIDDRTASPLTGGVSIRRLALRAAMASNSAKVAATDGLSQSRACHCARGLPAFGPSP
jgi:hypothetical protein